MQEQWRIGKCRKYDDRACPSIDEPEMKKAIRIFPKGNSAVYPDTKAWWDLKGANDKFSVNCNLFEERR